MQASKLATRDAESRERERGIREKMRKVFFLPSDASSCLNQCASFSLRYSKQQTYWSQQRPSNLLLCFSFASFLIYYRYSLRLNTFYIKTFSWLRISQFLIWAREKKLIISTYRWQRWVRLAVHRNWISFLKQIFSFVWIITFMKTASERARCFCCYF